MSSLMFVNLRTMRGSLGRVVPFKSAVSFCGPSLMERQRNTTNLKSIPEPMERVGQRHSQDSQDRESAAEKVSLPGRASLGKGGKSQKSRRSGSAEPIKASDDAAFQSCLAVIAEAGPEVGLELLQRQLDSGLRPSRQAAAEVLQAFCRQSLQNGVACAQVLPLAFCKHYKFLMEHCLGRQDRQGFRSVCRAMFSDSRLSSPRIHSTALISSFQSLASAKVPEPLEAVDIFEEHARFRGTRGAVPQVVGNSFLNALTSATPTAFAWFEQLGRLGFKPNIISYNTLLKSCMASCDIARAMQTLQEMADKQLKADEYTYNTLIKLYSYSGDAARALQVREDMRGAGFQPTASLLGSLIVVCSQLGLLERAFGFWQEAQRLQAQPPLDCLDALLNACAQAYQGPRAIGLLRALQAQGLRPSAVTYNVAIKACSSPPGVRLPQQQLDLAFSLFQEMRAAGLQPSLQTYTTLYSLCSQACQGGRALQSYRELVARGGPRDSQMCTALLAALASENLVQEAFEVFAEMEAGGASLHPTERSFRVMIRLCCDVGDLEAALQVYKKMRGQGLKPSNREFRLLTQACAERALRDGHTSPLPAKMVEILGLGLGAELDLHGLSEAEARAFVLCNLLSLQSAHRAGLPVASDLTIITGAGARRKTAPKIRSAILRLLVHELRILEPPEPWRTVSQPGFNRASASQLKTERRSNAGRVVVPKVSLQKWLESRAGT